MSPDILQFNGLLANVDSSILNLKLKNDFKIESMSDEEGAYLYSSLKSLPLVDAYSRLSQSFKCINSSEKKIYFISRNIEIDNRTYKKVLSNIEEVKSRGGVVIAITTKGDKEVKKKVDHTIHIPENSYILTPLLAVIPLQLFAYYIADLRGCDVDKPRHLAKSVTVE